MNGRKRRRRDLATATSDPASHELARSSRRQCKCKEKALVVDRQTRRAEDNGTVVVSLVRRAALRG